MSEVIYFGHTLSHEGVKPDPVKVKAMWEMQPPTCRGELETILRMINYFASVLPVSDIKLSKRSNT